ncbi:FtsQ-type POTRA domain-containing protein [bacterium]|nr:FtsQ-type POTRA domain-containing protein [bacterium]
MIWPRAKKRGNQRLRAGNSRKAIQQARNTGVKSGGIRKVALLISLVCFLALGGSALWLWLPTLVSNVDGWLKESGSFLVREIVVEGIHRCHRDDIIQALNLDSEQLIFTFSLVQAQARVEALPFIKLAMIRRRLPDLLQVEVVECKPRALLYLEDLYLVDEEGVVMARAPAGEVLDFPVISGFSLNEWQQRPQVWRRLLKKATNLLLIWEERGKEWPEKVAQIVLDEVCGVTLFTTGSNWELQLGSENYCERLERWRQVLVLLGERASSVKYFDCAGESSVVAGLRQFKIEADKKAGEYGQK